MRLGTLILPVCFLCLLAGVIWPTGHAVPGLLSELRALSIDIHQSPDDFVLWISVAWGALRALLTFALLVLAGQIWLGLAYAVCLQLCRGLRSPAYVSFELQPAEDAHWMYYIHGIRHCVSMPAAMQPTLCRLRRLPFVFGVALPLAIVPSSIACKHNIARRGHTAGRAGESQSEDFECTCRAQPGPSELPQSPNRQARRREYHLRNEE